jgi:hypothetical protein
MEIRQLNLGAFTFEEIIKIDDLLLKMTIKEKRRVTRKDFFMAAVNEKIKEYENEKH